MDPRKPGNKNMPDFDSLNDRLIAEEPTGPHLVINTNLDPENSTDNNPYYQGNQTQNPKAFREYFEE
jgi:hypothetical protein